MKILYCHNYYQHRGGEDLSFEADVTLLRQKGHEVQTFLRHNDSLTEQLPIKTAINCVWNRDASLELQEQLASFQPDILHCNNLFPQISASIYRAAKRLKVPVVQALRNYRVFCANAFFYRDNRVCTDCLGSKMRLSGIRHRCYRDSYTATAVVTAMQWAHQALGTYRKAVDMYFAPSEFTRQIYIEGGFNPDSIVVRPNFVSPDPGVGTGDGNYFVFAGRLSSEKGISTLLDAWKSGRISVPLKVVGNGPLAPLFDEEIPNVEYLGALPNEKVLDVFGRATAIIMPSQWYETFGRTIAEAFSRGTPAIVSDLGAMSELVQNKKNGFVFKSGDADDLVRVVNSLLALPQQPMRESARATYLEKYTSEASYQSLMNIYRRAQQAKRG